MDRYTDRQADRQTDRQIVKLNVSLIDIEYNIAQIVYMNSFRRGYRCRMDLSV